MKQTLSRSVPTLLIAAFAFSSAVGPGDARAEPSPYAAPKGKALVVFVRDRFGDRKVPYAILNAKGECLSVLEGVGSGLLSRDPGKQTLYVMSTTIQRLELDLAAGRTYFIRIESRGGMAKGVAKVTLAQRGSPAFKEINTWLAEVKPSEATPDSCRPDKKGRIPKKVAKADESWKTADAAEHAKYTMSKKDGLTAKEVSKL